MTATDNVNIEHDTCESKIDSTTTASITLRDIPLVMNLLSVPQHASLEGSYDMGFMGGWEKLESLFRSGEQ